MNRQGKTKRETPGLLLDSPHLLAHLPSFFSRFLLCLSLLSLGGAGAFGCFYTAFSLPVSPLPLILWGALFSVLFSIGFLQRRGRLFWTLLPPLLWVTSLFFCFPTAFQGFLYTVNQMIAAYASKAKLGLLTLPADPLLPREAEAACTLCAVLLLFLFQFGLGWCLIRKHSILAAFLLSGFLVALPMSFSILPDWPALLLLFLFWAALLLYRPLLGETDHIAEYRQAYHASGAPAAGASALPLLFFTGLLLLGLFALFPKEGYRRWEGLDKTRADLIDTLTLNSTFQGSGVGGVSSRVSLEFTGNRTYTGKTMLRIRSGKGEEDYLKGFAGSVYTGRSWEKLPSEDRTALSEALGEEKAQTLPARFEEVFEDSGLPSPHTYELSVKNVGANPRCAYVPYGIVEGSGQFGLLSCVDDGFLQAENRWAGIQEYSVSSIDVQPTLSLIYRAFFRASLKNPDLASLLAKDLPSSENDWEFEPWMPPEALLEAFPPQDSSFLRNASQYTGFVYSHYTQLPEDVRAELCAYLQEHGLTREHYPSLFLMAQAIIQQIQSECSYTLSPGLPPPGEDFALYFLLKNKKGYCVHFATAATVLLRAAGIPARYAEGYVAPSDFSQSWIDLLDYNAHAWVEVYLSGSGWYPIEATPGLDFSHPSRPPELSHSIDASPTPTPVSSAAPAPSPSNGTGKDSEETSRPRQEPSPASSSPEAVPSPAASGGAAHPEASQGPAALPPVLIIVPALLLFLLAGLFINRKLRLYLRKKERQNPDRNQAALTVYRHIQRLTKVSRRWFYPAPQIPEELKDLALKARFSQHTLTQEEWEAFLRCEEKLQAQLSQIHAPLSLLFYRYFLGLF